MQLMSILNECYEFGVQGIVINDGSSESAPEKFVAAKYSTGKVVCLMNLHPNILLVDGC